MIQSLFFTGMESYGYVEGKERSVIIPIPVKKSDWIISAVILIIVNISLFMFK